MTQNVLNVWAEAIGIVSGILVLLVFGLAVALPHRPKTRPGSSGHREGEEQEVHEEIRPDGYIDSFAHVIEEAGGALPLVVALSLPGVLLWWLIYLIANWTPS